jgi:hypothetical protein
MNNYILSLFVFSCLALCKAEGSEMNQAAKQKGFHYTMLWFPAGYDFRAVRYTFVFHQMNEDHNEEVMIDGLIQQMPLFLKKKMAYGEAMQFIYELNYYLERGRLRVSSAQLRELSEAYTWYKNNRLRLT